MCPRPAPVLTRDEKSMHKDEESAHVFIVRVWREPRELEDAAIIWRGVVEHVESGGRRYFTRLGAMTEYIRGYLEQMGVEFGPLSQVKRWLKG